MKIFVKTLKGTHFDIEVKPEDVVADVKKNIETVQGADVYPAVQQMLIYKGKVLKDDTTLAENSVTENSFIVIMLTKSKSSSGEGSTAVTAPTKKASEPSTPATAPAPPAPASTAPVATSATAATVTESVPVASSTTASDSDVYGQAASNLIAGSNLEGAIQQILDMGGGTWDRDTVVRALRAAYNNPERAVEYLYSGIPEHAEAPLVVRAPVVGQTTNAVAQPQQPAQGAAVATSGPNANPLDLFPQGLPNMGSGGAGAGTLDFLRNSQQFQALRAMVQANPQILQPMLQELGKQNPKHAIWLKFFPNEFFMLASIRSQETSDPLCMILYTCCDGRPGLATELCTDLGLPIVAALIRTVASVGFREDWFKLLLSRLCLEDIHFPALFLKLCEGNASENRGNTAPEDNLFSSEQAFLLRIISEILNERIDEVRVPDESALCVLGIFKRSVMVVDFATRGKSSLPTGSPSIDVMGYSLIILRDICAREGVGDLKKDSVDVVDMLLSNELIDILLSLLRDLEPPAIIRKTLKEGETQELIIRWSKLCPYRGFRKDLVSVIGNCAYRRKHVQDEIRQKNGILLLLQQCVTDDDNPYLREWGIWSMRNLLEGNAENQQTVADLQLQGSADVPELARLGLRVEVDQRTHRAKLVNIPGSYQKPVD